MLSTEQRLQTLLGTRLPTASIVDALIAALEHAEPDEMEPIALTLVKTGHQAGCTAVIRHLSRLPDAARRQVNVALKDDRSPAVTAAIERALGTKNFRVQLNAVGLARARSHLTLLPHLASLVDNSADELPARAAEAVLTLMTRSFGKRGRGHVHEVDRRLVDRVASDLIERATEHRQDEALIAAAIAVQQARPALQHLINDTSHPGSLALRRAVRLTGHPVVARNLLNWLARPPLDRPALRWMHQVRSTSDWSNLLDGGHLLLHPARRRTIRHVDRPMRCVPELDVMVQIDEGVQHRLPDLVMALPIATARKVRLLANCVALPAPLARMRCVVLLEGPAMLHAPQAMSTLEQFLCDRDLAVTTTAAWQRMAIAETVPRERLKQIESRAHRAIAVEATQRLASTNAQMLGERINRLPFNAALTAAISCLQHDRASTIALFTQKLDEGERSLRLRIIEFIRRLRLESACASILLRCADDGDSHIAASALRALAEVNTSEVHNQALKSLEHQDARVRANTVEALATIYKTDSGADTGSNVFSSLADDTSNRLRANAIGALLKWRHPSSTEWLDTMLRDPRPLHRVSALWLARRSRCTSVVPTVRTIARDDESAEIRTRAARAARFLELNNQQALPLRAEKVLRS